MYDPAPPSQLITLRAVFWRAFVEAHRRRPASFYLLLATPLVLLLGAHMFDHQDSPLRFAVVLSTLFLFVGVLLLQALLDTMHILRHSYQEHRQSYLETLGDNEFAQKLGKRVLESHRKKL